MLTLLLFIPSLSLRKLTSSNKSSSSSFSKCALPLLTKSRYNVTVKSNLYAKYYFELRALFKDNEKEFPLKPLDRRDADKLELRSKEYKDTFEGAQKAKERLTSTFGSLPTKPQWI